MRNPFIGQVSEPVVRFIVTDGAGAKFIPGANVSIILEDGTFVTSKTADQGGNVAFGKGELIRALSTAGISESYAERAPVLWYTVEAPGYVLQDGILFDPTVDRQEQWKKIYTVALKSTSAPVDSGVVLPAAIVLGVGIAIVLSMK